MDVGNPVESVAGPRKAFADVLQTRPAMEPAAGPRAAVDPNVLGPDRAVPELDRLVRGAMSSPLGEVDRRRADETTGVGPDRRHQPAQEIRLEDQPVVHDEEIRRGDAIEERLPAATGRCQRPEVVEPHGMTPRLEDGRPAGDRGARRVVGRAGDDDAEGRIALATERLKGRGKATRRRGPGYGDVDHRSLHVPKSHGPGATGVHDGCGRNLAGDRQARLAEVGRPGRAIGTAPNGPAGLALGARDMRMQRRCKAGARNREAQTPTM